MVDFSDKKEIYTFGVIISIAGFIVFGALIYNIIGWWSILISPIVSLGAMRPADGDKYYCWAWERRITQS